MTDSTYNSSHCASFCYHDAAWSRYKAPRRVCLTVLVESVAIGTHLIRSPVKKIDIVHTRTSWGKAVLYCINSREESQNTHSGAHRRAGTYDKRPRIKDRVFTSHASRTPCPSRCSLSRDTRFRGPSRSGTPSRSSRPGAHSVRTPCSRSWRRAQPRIGGCRS